MGPGPEYFSPVWESSHQPSDYQPPPTPPAFSALSLLSQAARLEEAGTEGSQRMPRLAWRWWGSKNCHQIVNFDAKNSNFPSAAFYFPTWRGPLSARLGNSCRLLGPSRLLVGAQGASVQPSNTNRFFCRAAGADSEKQRQSDWRGECLTDLIVNILMRSHLSSPGWAQ